MVHVQFGCTGITSGGSQRLGGLGVIATFVAKSEGAGAAGAEAGGTVAAPLEVDAGAESTTGATWGTEVEDEDASGEVAFDVDAFDWPESDCSP